MVMRLLPPAGLCADLERDLRFGAGECERDFDDLLTLREAILPKEVVLPVEMRNGRNLNIDKLARG